MKTTQANHRRKETSPDKKNKSAQQAVAPENTINYFGTGQFYRFY
jgi:hypothetical protein